MTGYVRKDTTNNIADGNVINAADLDNEFDGIQDAFNASTGHNHDGTSGEGAPITALGPTQDVTISATLLAPKTTNTVDIGSSALKFKDLFLAGNGSIGGTLAVTGVATFTAQPILSSLTASRAVFSDGSKGLVSNAITGTGNVVMSASPTLTGTIAAEALSASSTVTLSGGTANGVAYLNGSKVVTSGSALTFDGTRLTSTTGKFGGGVASNSASLMVNNATNTATGIQLFQDGIESWIMGMPANSAGLAWSASGSEQMRLTSTGLGIGTSSPAFKLQVVGASQIQTNAAGTQQVLQLNNSDTTAGTQAVKLGFSSAGSTKASINAAVYGNDYMTFNVGSDTERMRIEASGNLGLGVTPSAWGTAKAFQIGSSGFALSSNGAGSGDGSLTWNGYYNGTNWIYSYTGGVATRYRQNESGHAWFTAPSGTAGNAITFTQAMTLDASGNLGVGTTSPSARVHVVGGSAGNLNAPAVYIQNNRFLTFQNSAGSAWGMGIYADSSDNGWIGAVNNLTFNTGSGATERARIDTSGNLLVGKTATGLATDGIELAANNTIRATKTSSASVEINRLGTDGDTVLFWKSTSLVGSISVTGSATAYNTSSDYRLKNTIAPMTGALTKVAQLKPCTYKWNADGSDGEGFIAHELAEVVPQCVTGEKDAVDEDGNPKYQGIDTSFLVATLTAAIQELKAEFDAYKASHP